MRPQNDRAPLEPIDNGAELLPSVAETGKEIANIHSLRRGMPSCSIILDILF